MTALTPQIFGETERAKTEKAARSVLPAIDRDMWIEDRLAKYGSATVEGAQAYIAIVEATGGRTQVASTQGSIVAAYDKPDGTLFPLMLSYYSKGAIQLCLDYLVSRPAFASVDARQAIYDKLTAIVGPLSTPTLNGFPGFSVMKLNDPVVRDGLADFLQYINGLS